MEVKTVAWKSKYSKEMSSPMDLYTFFLLCELIGIFFFFYVSLPHSLFTLDSTSFREAFKRPNGQRQKCVELTIKIATVGFHRSND